MTHQLRYFRVEFLNGSIYQCYDVQEWIFNDLLKSIQRINFSISKSLFISDMKVYDLTLRPLTPFIL